MKVKGIPMHGQLLEGMSFPGAVFWNVQQVACFNDDLFFIDVIAGFSANNEGEIMKLYFCFSNQLICKAFAVYKQEYLGDQMLVISQIQIISSSYDESGIFYGMSEAHNR
ncbi:hypothetical protein [Paenibacillus sp. S25]|uniref:hypothetical protein n=1 Tax=Paenibacillus sp. S25 TaxID=2823905 RepID=UPI0031F677B6